VDNEVKQLASSRVPGISLDNASQVGLMLIGHDELYAYLEIPPPNNVTADDFLEVVRSAHYKMLTDGKSRDVHMQEDFTLLDNGHVKACLFIRR
jgi:hypothetical protein